MGAIYKRPGQVRRDGTRGPATWQVRYRTPEGEQRNETFPRRAAADRRLHEIEDAKNRGEWIDPAQGKILLADWIKKYQANNTRNLRRSSQAVEEACLRTHVVPPLVHR